MSSRHRHRWFVGQLRRLLVGMSAIAYLVATLGFPLPLQKNGQVVAVGHSTCGTGACGCPPQEKAKGCCCCAQEATQEVESCCQESPTAPPDVVWVIGEKQQRCAGLATSWISTGAVVLVVPLDLDFRAEAGEWLPLAPEFPSRRSHSPPAPPPRSARQVANVGASEGAVALLHQA